MTSLLTSRVSRALLSAWAALSGSLSLHLIVACALSVGASSALLCGPSFAQGEREAPARSAKDRAKAAFKKGSEAFAAERWSEALDHFEEAYQAYPLPLMMFNIASTYERLGDLPTALARYEAFIATGKDDGDAAARVQDLTERLSTWAELRLSSTPSNAEVFVGSARGRPRGRTPITLRLPPKRQVSLTLRSEGYIDKTLTPSFKELERRALKVSLQGEPAFVRVLGSPQEAEVRVSGLEGERARGLPFTRELGVGVYELEISAPGYIPQRKTVTLKPVHSAQAPLVVEVKLASSEGVALLNLTSDQEGALLFIDGRPAGQTPLSSPLKLEEGEHLIELKGSGGGLYSERVSLQAGVTRSVHAKLSAGFSFTKRHVGFTLASVGAASLIGGLISGGLAMSSAGDLEGCRADFRCGRGQGELDLAQEVRAYASAADWMMGVGFALAAGGAAIILLDGGGADQAPTPAQGEQPPAQAAARFGLSPTRGGLSAVGGFTF